MLAIGVCFVILLSEHVIFQDHAYDQATQGRPRGGHPPSGEKGSGRRACVGCGATYHLEYAPTKKEGICDVCGGELILRDDDKPETVEKRLGVYHEQTQPLIDYYTNAGILKRVDGTVDIEEVFQAVVQILGE